MFEEAGFAVARRVLYVLGLVIGYERITREVRKDEAQLRRSCLPALCLCLRANGIGRTRLCRCHKIMCLWRVPPTLPSYLRSSLRVTTEGH